MTGESSNETCVNLTATVCSPNYSPVRIIFFIILSYLERTAIPKYIPLHNMIIKELINSAIYYMHNHITTHRQLFSPHSLTLFEDTLH